MNKAFTANINDQVTARGYLDENNQLIMLEPEGSGGGGDLRTVQMTFINDVGAEVIATIPRILEDPDGYKFVVCGQNTLRAGVFELASASDGGIISINTNGDLYEFNVTGDAAFTSTGVIEYTGDFTVTCVSIESEG